ncbi:hypothetical protein ES703_85236 [subsurface metagenome]
MGVALSDNRGVSPQILVDVSGLLASARDGTEQIAGGNVRILPSAVYCRVFMVGWSLNGGRVKIGTGPKGVRADFGPDSVGRAVGGGGKKKFPMGGGERMELWGGCGKMDFKIMEKRQGFTSLPPSVFLYFLYFLRKFFEV